MKEKTGLEAYDLAVGTTLLLAGHGHRAITHQHAQTCLARAVCPGFARLQRHENGQDVSHRILILMK